jgi:hypothetical protein
MNRAEERALEAMRKELASQRVPELPWDDMERELLAKLDEAPMTSQPRSLSMHASTTFPLRACEIRDRNLPAWAFWYSRLLRLSAFSGWQCHARVDPS